MTQQFELPMRDADRAMLKGIRLYAALRVFAKAVGTKRLAELWGCDEGTAIAKIERRNRNRVHVEEWLAVFDADADDIVYGALCEQAAREVGARKGPPVAEADRLRAALRDTLGAEVAELVERKAGL